MTTTRANSNNENENSFIIEFFNNYFLKPTKRYGALVSKELKVLYNDKAAMIITYVIPLIVIFMLTIGSSSDTLFSEDSGSKQLEEASESEIPLLGIIDYDTSEGFPNRDLSVEFLDAFEEAAQEGKCDLIQTGNQSELEFMIGKGEINAFIIIPDLFEFNLSIHLPVIVPIAIDSVNSQAMQPTQILIESIIDDFKRENDFTGVFSVEKIAVNLPEKFQVFFASMPMIIALAIFGIGCLTSTQAIVSDIPKDRMVLTPTNKSEMLAAKVTANFLIQSGVAIIFVLTTLLTGVQIQVSYFTYLGLMLIMEINAVITGVFISSISKTPLAAFQFFIFLFIFQSIAIFFVEDPRILATLPMYNAHELIMQVVLRGQSLWSVREFLQNVIIECVVLYIFSFIVFKRKKTML